MERDNKRTRAQRKLRSLIISQHMRLTNAAELDNFKDSLLEHQQTNQYVRVSESKKHPLYWKEHRPREPTAYLRFFRSHD